MTEKPSNEGSGTPPRDSHPSFSLADRELLDRYLAGKLDPGAEQDVEARIVGDAKFRLELELTQQLRTGLRELQVSGQLESALAPKPVLMWQRPGFGIAASVAAGVLGLTALALHEQVQRGRTALAQAEQVLERQRPVAIKGLRVISIARTRATVGEPDVRIPLPQPGEMLELRVDAGPEPGAVYHVTLERDMGNGSSSIMLLDLQSVTTSVEGEVVLAVHPALLAPGDYQLALRVPGSTTYAEAIRYRLRVED